MGQKEHGFQQKLQTTSITHFVPRKVNSGVEKKEGGVCLIVCLLKNMSLYCYCFFQTLQRVFMGKKRNGMSHLRWPITFTRSLLKSRCLPFPFPSLVIPLKGKVNGDEQWLRERESKERNRDRNESRKEGNEWRKEKVFRFMMIMMMRFTDLLAFCWWIFFPTKALLVVIKQKRSKILEDKLIGKQI